MFGTEEVKFAPGPMYVDYLECACESPEHTLKFVYDPSENELRTSVFLNTPSSILKRVWVGLKYILGYKSEKGHWDCFVLHETDVQKMATIISQLVRRVPKGKN